MRHSPIIILAAIGLSACATGYKVEAGKDTALITFEKGYLDGLGMGRSTSQQYNTPMSSDGCNNPKLLANFTWTGPASKTKKVQAGEMMTIVAVTIDYNVSAMANRIETKQSVNCSSRVNFIPVAGESYRMKFVEKGAGVCALEFVDLKTGILPESARVEDEYSCSAP